MKREIKFRGKSLSGKWLYGDLLHIGGELYIISEDDVDSIDRYEVDPATVGQYTGLKDKNGIEIYDGDIINLDSWMGAYEVKFVDGAFCFSDNESSYCNDIHYIHHAGINQCIVIGNIHDNPEFLEGKE